MVRKVGAGCVFESKGHMDLLSYAFAKGGLDLGGRLGASDDAGYL